MLVYNNVLAVFIFYLIPELSAINITCDYLIKSTDSNDGYYTIKGYSSINDIKFACNIKNYPILAPSSSVGFHFKSTKSMIFDSPIDFTQFYFDLRSLLVLNLHKFEGFYLNTYVYKNNFNNMSNLNIKTVISILMSNFEFYYEKKKQIANVFQRISRIIFGLLQN